MRFLKAGALGIQGGVGFVGGFQGSVLRRVQHGLRLFEMEVGGGGSEQTLHDGKSPFGGELCRFLVLHLGIERG